MRRAAARTLQRGAALLMAMLTVVLVATLASAMLWQQWRGIEVESAQRTRVQSAWILVGALDWARLILREDARQGGADYLSEPWAVPLAPARLSTFLAAEHGQALVTDDNDAAQAAFLSGQIEDLQGRLNVTNLIQSKQIDAPSMAAWTRLFKHLNLPESELQAMAQALLRAQNVGADSTDAGQSSASLPLQPLAVADLRWLGLSQRSLQTLQDFITLLPVRTPVNLNTAPPEVLLASVPGMDMAVARGLVQARASHHMNSLADADKLLDKPEIHFDASLQSVSSQFFMVNGQLRLGDVTLQEMSVLQRDGLQVKTLSRTRQMLSGPDPTLQ
ncbi:type II secretion system minor pseudopilin GspK [Rhodoferax sp.]|uniref:type II secretion system minor pseudopilin GspK n=1 Tax=Rhodoferax sp. TaxID=50421 RepID=UPI002850F6FC|nr:type II secretion system minor pseudopilin GspK [Rhodoferax sp.]MDR3367581.1 type II secretion system minor pseudopilin GspK [Rhodoferax sp.]